MSLEVCFAGRVGEFDLDVAFRAPGGITALFGPSGAGKTLTLRCVAGLDSPATGRISIGDSVLFDRKAEIDLPPRERGLGYVFQHHALFPHLDVEGNIGFGLRGMPRSDRMARVAELIDLVGLGGFEGRRPSDLSGGERQRVALARALAPEPSLLLLDEPFSGLDDEIRWRLLDELLQLHRRTGVAMLLVTHDVEEVRRLAHWLVRLRKGRVVDEGLAAELIPGRAPAAERTSRSDGDR